MLTNKNLVDLAKKQVLLDNFIEEKLVDKNSQVLFKKRLVAFLVELGEYANEERAFKFWSQKAPSKLEVRLEEYIDGLHFILSLGNSLDFDFANYQFHHEQIDPIDNYLEIIKHLSHFIESIDAEHYAKLLDSFLNVMLIQNYQEIDILKIYQQKNQINYERQTQGY